MIAMAVITSRGLTKYYGKTRGIEDLDLEVGAGEIFGYLGPNGAGKTTTIRLFLDLLRPNTGEVTILGGSAGDVEVRRRIGYLPGELALYGRMTGRELLSYLASLRGLNSVRSAETLAERLDLDVTRRVGDLSRGNKQKVGLIQALMHEPELLLLDEPTSGLDPLVQQEFYRIAQEAKSDGRTVFLSSHVLSEVERIADRVAIIRDGHLVVVEGLAALKARAIRRIEFHFAGAPPPGLFDGLASVQEYSIDDNMVVCTVVGSLGDLLKAAARYEVTNVISHETDLEDVFLDFYRDGESVP
jgi:ABC-2 type transport system ATP-binding protein